MEKKQSHPAWAKLVEGARSILARRAMRKLLPAWAREALSDSSGMAFSDLQAAVKSASRFLISTSKLGAAPLEDGARQKFIALWACAGVEPQRVAMAAMLMRDVGLAAEAGRRAPVDLDAKSKRREVEVAMASRRAASSLGDEEADLARWRALPVRELLSEMAINLGHGAPECLQAFMAGQEAFALAGESKVPYAGKASPNRSRL